MGENESMCGDCCEDPCECKKTNVSAVCFSDGLEGLIEEWDKDLENMRELLTYFEEHNLKEASAVMAGKLTELAYRLTILKMKAA
jgi:hypothetical protein